MTKKKSLKPKIDSFLKSEKGKTWTNAFPDYFQDAFRKMSTNLLTKFLNDFVEHVEK